MSQYHTYLSTLLHIDSTPQEQQDVHPLGTALEGSVGSLASLHMHAKYPWELGHVLAAPPTEHGTSSAARVKICAQKVPTQLYKCTGGLKTVIVIRCR